MSAPENNDLRTLIRDLALRRESHDRRQLYWALIKAQVWTPVNVDSAESHLQPADLHPLDREALGGMASFSVFTHEGAAATWQADEGAGIALRLQHISFVDFLPLVLGAGAGSVYLNPSAKYSGELYRHELQTCLDGAEKLARRSVSARSTQASSDDVASSPSLWSRLQKVFK